MMHPFRRCVFDKENFFPNETAAAPDSVAVGFTVGNICSIRRKLAKLGGLRGLASEKGRIG